MVPTAGPNAGDAFQFASGPKECEMTGPWFTENEETLFLSIQHPGEETKTDDAKGWTSTWPDGAPANRRGHGRRWWRFRGSSGEVTHTPRKGYSQVSLKSLQEGHLTPSSHVVEALLFVIHVRVKCPSYFGGPTSRASPARQKWIALRFDFYTLPPHSHTPQRRSAKVVEGADMDCTTSVHPLLPRCARLGLGRRHRIKELDQSFAVDVEFVEDVENVFEVDIPVDAPDDDVEVFFTGFEVVGDAVEQEGSALEFAFQEAVVVVA